MRYYFLLLIPFMSFSQVQITGVVKIENENTVEFANVVITNRSNEFVTGGITDEKGRFNVFVEKGEYSISISYLGHTTWSKLIVVEEAIDLKTILLTSDTELDEVFLTSKKKVFEKEVDRLVFNVSESVGLSGGDAMDALRITPRVRIENGEISMIGKDNLRVMVDDKILQISGESLANYLNSIAVEDIQKIEVISTPPSKYSAEGNSGLINIVFKKGKKNLWSSSIRGAYKQYTYPVGTLGANFNYNKNKLSITNSISYSNGSKVITDNKKVNFTEQTWSGDAPRKYFYKPVLSGRVSVDYQISEKLSIGTQYLGEYDRIEAKEKDDTEVINVIAKTVDSIVRTRAFSNNTSPTHSFNIFSEYKLDSLNKKISFNLDYFTFKNNKKRNFTSGNYFPDGMITPQSFNAGENYGKQKIENYAAKLDVEMPLKIMNLDFGGRFTSTKTNNSLTFYDLTTGNPVLDMNQSNEFDFKENTGALYISANKSFGKKWEVQMGLRLESTQTTGISLQLNQKNENDYTRLFPTAYVVYNPNDKNNISISYSSRIRRPSFEFLNPFRIVENQYTLIEGNPFLQPSFSDNIEFSYTRNNKWVNTLYYSKTTNGFTQVTLSDVNTSIQQITPVNYYDAHYYGLTESYSYTPFSWWDNYTSLDLYYGKNESRLRNIDVNSWEYGAYFSTSNTWTLNTNKTIFLNANYSLMFPTSGEIYSTKQYNTLDVSLKFSLAKKKLQVALVGNDLFGSYRPQYKERSNDVTIEYNSYYDNRNFRLSLLYKFGNAKIKGKNRKFGNKEEKKRVSN